MKKPFFAKFLENQISAATQNQVKAGGQEDGLNTACDTPAAAHNTHCPPFAVTLKFPCDAADVHQPC